MNNTIDKQIKEMIESSISRNMNIKLPIQSNEAEKNLLVQIINNQTEIIKESTSIRICVAQLKTDVSGLKRQFEYYSIGDSFRKKRY